MNSKLDGVDLSAICAKKTSFKISDGGGMFLLIEPNGGKYWRLSYRYAGKYRTLALGVYPSVTLADARIKRENARELLAAGVDPCASKKAEKAIFNEEQKKEKTFIPTRREEMLAEYIAGIVVSMLRSNPDAF